MAVQGAGDDVYIRMIGIDTRNTLWGRYQGDKADAQRVCFFNEREGVAG